MDANFLRSANSTFFEDDDNQETEAIATETYDNRDMVMFAIDCSPKMMTKDIDGYTPFVKVMKCLHSVLVAKVFSNTTDLVGVLLYGTEKAENPANFGHVYILQDLDSPTPTRIKQIESMMNGEVDFEQLYGITSAEFPLGDVFWTCADIFSAITQKRTSKRVFLFTNQDHPHSDNEKLRNAAIQRAKDLLDMNIRIELFGLDRIHHNFDYKHFYREVFIHEKSDDFYDDDEANDFIMEKGSTKLEELMTRIRRKEVKKRSLFSIPFNIAKDLTIGVKGYSLAMEQKKGSPKKVLTEGERIQEVQTVTAYQCMDSNLFLTDYDVKYFFPYGGEKVVFTKDEINAMRNVGDPGLTLLGFRPHSILSNYPNVKHSYFIYPSEMEYEGSTRTFTALLNAVLDQDKIVMCYLIRRKNTMPNLVALVPQNEKLDDDGIQITPPGFNVICLPYADDIRQIPVESTPHATSLQVDFMKSIINKLFIKGDYDPMVFENPGLQQHYATLQAIALDEPLEKSDDSTIPKFEMIDNRLGDEIIAFKDLIPNYGNLMENASNINQKRKDIIGDSGTSGKKRQATHNLSVEQAYKDQQLDKCTVPMLKEWLNSRGILPQGNKPNLMDQVYQALKSV
ncbi:SPOC like C-terminal domain-containing protein [Halteromyces radiatus]|uniref:SPOC like C-terminal domain-containing protein n=1 Tax=Halteromyces radiatus TaxID=101107 RepID=UPI00221E9674|nr:SPOC like C-terminal domain-containing protein [Halteromyces radiatus]KAI8088997.1 SPOC like C-terminal domain-containing protein [Halteromyces radiatus]